MATITLSQLSRRYGPYMAVDGVNLVVRDGEALTLLGPAGCGKSTILRIIAGLVDPSAGSVAMDGRVISSAHGSVAPERRDMAMLFHTPTLWSHMTVYENVAFALQSRGVEEAGVRKRVTQALEAAGVAPATAKRPKQLSQADQQRVAIARAIAIEPRVLLLDDAFAKLDPADRHLLAAEFRRLQTKMRLTTIAVSSDVHETMLLSDRVAAIHRGRIEQLDTPGALYMRPETRIVATLLGRALLFDGQRLTKQISFAGLTVPCAQVKDAGSGAGPVTVCVRPEHIQLLSTVETPREGWLTRTGRIQQRTFFGTHWSYTFAADPDGTVFEISAPNTTVFPAGAEAVLSLDPAHIVLLP